MNTTLIVGKMVLVADGIALIVLADVVPKIFGRCYCHIVCWLCGRWKATVVDVMTTCIGWLADIVAIVADGIDTWME